MKLNEWIQANWKTLLLIVAFLLLLDIDLQLHSANSRSRRIASTVSDLNGRVSDLEETTTIMQQDLDEITGHDSGSDEGDNDRAQN